MSFCRLPDWISGSQKTITLIIFLANAIWIAAESNTNWHSIKYLQGHLKPIGNQREIIRGQIAEFDAFIDGPSFYRDFWAPARPAVFRGVIRHTKAMKQLVNATYMREKFGSVVGLVDRRTSWVRGGEEAPPRSAMNYSDFQDKILKEQIYWDDEIPEGHQILQNLFIPLPIECEELRRTLIYINMMENSGQVSYVFHRDYADNLFHFIAGKKTWLIANSTFKDAAYIGQKTESPDMSPVPPDSVDLIKYPKMAEIDFHEVVLNPGDVMYIPRNWLHYVRSRGRPNIAINIWFGSEFVTNHLPSVPDCKRQRRNPKKMLKEKL
uniref:bifunctional peptidase and (3S)-lysyl hydroxylase JMJD7-like n=1 Tax=Styela clava TaxID=7725 RepID=UPI00193AA404|nr:bifunctional peptidase and (3S)-lysyl hydroxylase JMJD7-like [Styela clava]